MRFLVDNSVSWRVARDLREGGHDAVHVESLGLAEAEDSAVFVQAVAEARVLISQDADFGPIHSVSDPTTGVLLLRLSNGSPRFQSTLLLENLVSLSPCLASGGYAVIADSGIIIVDAGRVQGM